MFKTLLFTSGLSAYHFLNVFLFQIPQEVIVPTWVEKLSVISILAIVIYYLYKENEKHKSKFDTFQERLFVLEKESLIALTESVNVIKDFQGVMQQIASTLHDMNLDIKELARKTGQ